MADIPLSAQMEDEYKVSKWNRNTVADGTWLQKYTIEKLNDRDIFLANAIDTNSDDIREALNQEIETRTNDDVVISAALTGVSGDFYTFSANVENSASTIVNTIETFSSYVESSAAALDQKINNESNRAQDREDELANKIYTLEAATDVIMVYGTYPDFINTSAELWNVSAGYLTENDVVKILIDDSQGNSANQTYYQAKNVNYDTSSCTWTKIGELDPYYNTAQIDEYFNMLSGTIADNYLSASTDAVKEGHNIKVTKQTGPIIEIATKENVDFTELSADTAWIDTISADVSAFDFYETTSGKRLSETQQGLLINTTDSPFDPTKSASEGDVFWPANFEQIFSAWYDTDKLINIKYTNNLDNITRLYTLHNVRQYTDNDFTYYDLNFISNDDKVAYTAYAKVKRNGGEGGGAPTATVLYACDEGPIDVEYTGENGVYVSGDHKVGLSSTYETALKEGSAASAYITSHSGDFLNSAQSAYNKLTFKYGTSTKDYQANSSAYSFIFSAGSGIDFITGTNQITISSNDTTYQGSTYISTANNIISVTGNLIGSAESGNLAWKALTGANWKADTTNMGDISAGFTLSAGTGVGFNKNNTNHILTISAEGKTYDAGDYISITGNTNKINVTGTLINSAQSGQSAYDWIMANENKLVYTANFSGSNSVITGYGTSAFAGGISSISVGNTVFTGRNVNLYDSNNIDFTTANNSLTINLHNNISLGESESTKIFMNTTEDVIGADGPVIVIDNAGQSQLQLFNNKIIRNGTTTWDKVISASNGNFVSAYNQPITVATATTLPNPIPDGIYYIV